MPQIPVPTASRYEIVYSSSITIRNDAPKPSHQPRVVGRVSTMALIFAVTEPTV